MVSFTYDSEGVTTLYFLISVTACVIVPATYYFWPRAKDSEDDRLERLRPVHVRSKWFHKAIESRRTRKGPWFTVIFEKRVFLIFADF